MDQWHYETYAYKYYIEETDRYRILEYMYDKENQEQRYAYRRFMKVVLLFKSEREKFEFEAHIKYSIDLVKKEIIACDKYNYISSGNSRKDEVYCEKLRIGHVLNKHLKEWRATKNE